MSEISGGVTLDKLEIKTPADIQHYGNNALSIIAVDRASLEALVEPDLLKYLERIEIAEKYLKQIVDESAVALAAANKDIARLKLLREQDVDRWHDVLKIAHSVRQGSVLYSLADIEKVAREALSQITSPVEAGEDQK